MQNTSQASSPQVIIKSIGLGGIGAPPELWSQRDPKAVRDLVKAVRHHGATLRLITVRDRGCMLGYELVDGLTKLQAARVLKLGAIRAIVLPENSQVSAAPRSVARKDRLARAGAAGRTFPIANKGNLGNDFP